MSDDDLPTAIAVSDAGAHFLDVMRERLARGGTVHSALGDFAVERRHGYTGRNPKRGEVVVISPNVGVWWCAPAAVLAALQAEGRAKVNGLGLFVIRRGALHFKVSQVLKGMIRA